MKISFRQFVEDYFPEHDFTEEQFKLAEQVTSKGQSSLVISRAAGFQRLRETIYSFNQHKRKIIKQEIKEIAAGLPYSSSEAVAQSGMAQLEKLVDEL